MNVPSSRSNNFVGPESSVTIADSFDDNDLGLDLEGSDAYLDEIQIFKKNVRKEFFDIKPSWSGMNIKETTRDQLEMQIQSERVLSILNKSVKQIEYTGYLSHFLRNDAELIRKYMPKDKADLVIKKCTRNIEFDLESNKKMPKYKNLVGCSIDVELQQVLGYICENDCLWKYAHIKKVPMDPFVVQLVNNLRRLIDVVKSKLETTAAEEIQREILLKTALRDTKERMVNIKRLEEKLLQQYKDMEVKLAAKDVCIKQTEEKIRDVRAAFKEKIDDIVQQSEKIMIIETNQSDIRQAELSAEAKDAQHQYQSLLDQHLADEKILRAKRLKVEAQLANWLTKYDQDIGDRQAQMDELMDGYEAEREQLLELENLMADQDIIYDEYKAEKDDEDLTRFRQRVEAFTFTRAAKIIQRFWRAYRRRKLARRKARRERAKAKAAARGKIRKV